MLILVHGHPDFSAGGAETAAFGLFHHLRRRPDTIPVIAAVAPAEKIGVDRVFGARSGRPDEVLVAMPPVDAFSLCSTQVEAVEQRLDVLVKRFRPQIVHIHHFLGFGLQVVEYFAARRIPVVLTLHEYLPICHHHGQMQTTTGQLCHGASAASCAACFPDHGGAAFHARRRLVSHYLRQVQAVVAPSAFLAERYAEWGGLGDLPVEVIENPLHPDRLALAEMAEVVSLWSGPAASGYGSELDYVSIAFFGRFTPFKGLHVLLRALTLLKPEHRARLRVDLHGGGLETQTEAFRTQITGLLAELQDCVVDLGPYANARVQELMGDYDWIVVPSTWWENSPVVIQEALAAGVPVLASRIGGMREKIEPGVTGHLVEANSPAHLARHLAALAEGRITRPHIDRASLAANHRGAAEAHAALYRRVAAGEGGRGAPRSRRALDEVS